MRLHNDTTDTGEGKMSLHSRHFHRGNLTYDNMRFGVILITWGLFKKPVIVDGVGHLR